MQLEYLIPEFDHHFFSIKVFIRHVYSKFYYVSGGTVKQVTNRMYNNTGHKYEITFTAATVIELVSETDILVSETKLPIWNFIKLSELRKHAFNPSKNNYIGTSVFLIV